MAGRANIAEEIEAYNWISGRFDVVCLNHVSILYL